MRILIRDAKIFVNRVILVEMSLATFSFIAQVNNESIFSWLMIEYK